MRFFNSFIIKAMLGIVATCFASGVIAQKCQKSGTICVQGPETRIVAGAPIYKACWQFQDTYSCYDSVTTDTCAPLRPIQGCFELAANCAENNFAGVCVRFSTTMRCDHAEATPPGVTALPPVFTITSDSLVPSDQCNALSSEPNCTKIDRVCTAGPETRVINGLSVYKDCWAYEDKYMCATPQSTVSDCSQYASNNKCTLKSTACINVLPGGQCGTTEKTYKCEETPATTTTTEVCDTMSCDANGVCIKIADSADKDFGTTAASMELARQIGTYIDPNSITAFNGEVSMCSKGNLGLSSCCGSKGGGQNNASLAMSMLPNLGTAAKEVIDVGSSFVYDSLTTNSSLQQGVGTMISQINNWFSGSADYDYFNGSFDPSFSYMGFTASVGAASAGTVATMTLGTTNVYISFNPYALLASVAIQWLTACDQSDMLTGMRKGQRLCHHVGTYCGEKFLGACIKEYEGHCCYNSRLARIVQEQGRPQIGKSWGSAEAPQCGGFTEQELNQLDFSRMDLSEFVAEIQQKAVNTVPGTNRAAANVTNKVNSYFNNGQSNGGGLYLPSTSTGNMAPTTTGNAPTRQGQTVQ